MNFSIKAMIYVTATNASRWQSKRQSVKKSLQLKLGRPIIRNVKIAMLQITQP